MARELTPEQEMLLTWLLGGEDADPEWPTTFNQFADNVLSVSRRTAYRWKTERPFLMEWDRRMRLEGGAPARLQEQLTVLHEIGTDPDQPAAARVSAIEKYWKLLGQASPDKLEVNAGVDVEDWSDADLIEAASNVRELNAG